jgi:hypothetical protein
MLDTKRREFIALLGAGRLLTNPFGCTILGRVLGVRPPLLIASAT